MSTNLEDTDSPGAGRRWLGALVRFGGPIVLVAAGVLGARVLILSREAPPTRDRPERATRALVEAIRYDTPDVTLPGFGVVEARRSVSIRPTVGGPVVEVHPSLLAGGRIDEGEALVVLDPRDFDLAVVEAEAGVASARANLDVELGNAAVAASEWELLDGRIETDEAGRRLALREPFVQAQQAALDTAEARLERARLDRERSTIRAPFDALVLSEDVEVGALASAGAEIARLVDRSEFLVVASLKAGQVSQLAESGTQVVVTRVGSDPPLSRLARLAGVRGEVDAIGRMARVQVVLPEPLSDDFGPLLLGDYVRVDFPLDPIGEVASLPRSALREGDRVWIANEDDRLEIREVQVVLRRKDDVLLSGGVEAGESVIVGAVAVPLPGMKLAPVPAENPGTEGETSEPAITAEGPSQ